MRFAAAALTALALAASASEARSEPQANEVTTVSEARAESSGWTRELESEMMSPYCPGRSLIECPSPQATELRLWIAAQEKAGLSRGEVEAQLFQQFGDQLRHSPRAEGFGLWAYLVPGLALLAGGGLVVAFLRRGVGAAAAPPAPAPPVRDPELERALEEELRAS
jgi:cytochrome c-type biogenesis protein CcmH/NrfF